MKSFVVSAGMIALLFAVSGCGSNSDSLVKEQIKNMNDLADAVESNAPEAKLKELQQRLVDTGKKLEELKLSDDDKKKLFERHKDDYAKAVARFAQPKMLKALGEFAKAGIGGTLQADADGATRLTAVEQNKPVYQSGMEATSKSGGGDPQNDTGPIPFDNWNCKFYEMNYPIKLKSVSRAGGGGISFKLTFVFTEDDTEGKLKNETRLKGVIHFFDAENIPVAQARTGHFENELTGKKGEGFRYIVNITDTTGSFRLSELKRAEVREK